jgi:hypothetical protein
MPSLDGLSPEVEEPYRVDSGPQKHTGHKKPPTTPPSIPTIYKRPFERSVSPASSIHPTEASSPEQETLDRFTSDNLSIIELPDSDVGSLTDAEIVHPAELEEAEDSISETCYEAIETTIETTYESDSDSDSGISSRFARLDCLEQEEDYEMARKRLQRRLSKRATIQVLKRTHSQIADDDTGATDTDEDNVDLRSGRATARRLMRRKVSLSGGRTYMSTMMDSTENHDDFAVENDDGISVRNREEGQMNLDLRVLGPTMRWREEQLASAKPVNPRRPHASQLPLRSDRLFLNSSTASASANASTSNVIRASGYNFEQGTALPNRQRGVIRAKTEMAEQQSLAASERRLEEEQRIQNSEPVMRKRNDRDHSTDSRYDDETHTMRSPQIPDKSDVPIGLATARHPQQAKERKASEAGQ